MVLALHSVVNIYAATKFGVFATQVVAEPRMGERGNEVQAHCRRSRWPSSRCSFRRLAAAAEKPRVIVTADPELDDSNSLIRYLLYSPDFDTEGLIYASSGVHWKGDGQGTRWMVPGREYTRLNPQPVPVHLVALERGRAVHRRRRRDLRAGLREPEGP